MTKNKNNKAREMHYQLLKEIVENFHSETDILGSYTGLPNGKDKTPMQDADDLWIYKKLLRWQYTLPLI